MTVILYDKKDAMAYVPNITQLKESNWFVLFPILQINVFFLPETAELHKSYP